MYSTVNLQNTVNVQMNQSQAKGSSQTDLFDRTFQTMLKAGAQKTQQKDTDYTQKKPSTNDSSKNQDVKEDPKEQEEVKTEDGSQKKEENPVALAALASQQVVTAPIVQVEVIQENQGTQIQSEQQVQTETASVLSAAVQTDTKQQNATQLTGEQNVKAEDVNAKQTTVKETIETPVQTVTTEGKAESKIPVQQDAKATQTNQNKENMQNQLNEAQTKSSDKSQNQQTTQVKVEKQVTTNTEIKETVKTDTGENLQAAQDTGKNPFLDTVQIKVGDTIDVSKGNFAADMAEQITIKLPQKANEFEIQLTPKELGKINIKMTYEAGQALVTMTCSNPKTLSLLAENARSICDIIQNNTGMQTTVTVQEEKDNYQQQEHQNQQQSQQENRQEQAHKESQRHREQSVDFLQQMRLGLVDGSNWVANSRFF